MSQLLTLLQQSIFITTIDLDNATYTTSAIQPLKPENQKRAIFWSTLIEFVGRLALAGLFLFLTNEDEPLFTLFGIEFTIESISLFGAGVFLLIRNGRELIELCTLGMKSGVSGGPGKGEATGSQASAARLENMSINYKG